MLQVRPAVWTYSFDQALLRFRMLCLQPRVKVILPLLDSCRIDFLLKSFKDLLVVNNRIYAVLGLVFFS